MDGVKSEELKTMLATHFILSLNQVPTPDDLRMKSREYLLIKPRAQNRYNNYGNYSGTNTGANSSWYRPRVDMDKMRSCANCVSMDSHVSASSLKQELATKEVEQWVRSELKSTDLREKFNILSKTTEEEDKQEPRKQALKLNVISGRTFGMTKEGTKIMSIISVAGHQVVINLSEPSEITLIHQDIYADYLRKEDPKPDSRAVRALLTRGGPMLMRVDGHYIEVHGPYPILMNVDGINIYTKAHVTDASDQVGRIDIGQEELKVRRIRHNAMLEQDAWT